MQIHYLHYTNLDCWRKHADLCNNNVKDEYCQIYTLARLRTNFTGWPFNAHSIVTGERIIPFQEIKMLIPRRENLGKCCCSRISGNQNSPNKQPWKKNWKRQFCRAFSLTQTAWGNLNGLRDINRHSMLHQTFSRQRGQPAARHGGLFVHRCV